MGIALQDDADAVVLGVPFTVLRGVELDPSLGVFDVTLRLVTLAPVAGPAARSAPHAAAAAD